MMYLDSDDVLDAPTQFQRGNRKRHLYHNVTSKLFLTLWAECPDLFAASDERRVQFMFTDKVLFSSSHFVFTSYH